MISIRPSLITEHHSVSSLNDPAREASPCSRYLLPARDAKRPAPWDVTFTSRWRQRSERIEPRTYFADASVDPTDARNATVQGFGRCDRRAQKAESSAMKSPHCPW